MKSNRSTKTGIKITRRHASTDSSSYSISPSSSAENISATHAKMLINFFKLVKLLRSYCFLKNQENFRQKKLLNIKILLIK
jgi:hypothetical protein